MLARWLAVVGIILVLAVAGYVFVTKSSRNAVPNFSNSNLSSECTPKFTHHFTDIAIIDSIVPPIFRNSKGIMPTMLINITGRAPLYMPANGKLVQGSYHNEEGAQFYMWEIDIGCNVTVVFDHVTEPMEKVKRLFPSAPRDDSQTDFFETPLAMARSMPIIGILQCITHRRKTICGKRVNLAIDLNITRRFAPSNTTTDQWPKIMRSCLLFL